LLLQFVAIVTTVINTGSPVSSVSSINTGSPVSSVSSSRLSPIGPRGSIGSLNLLINSLVLRTFSSFERFKVQVRVRYELDRLVEQNLISVDTFALADQGMARSWVYELLLEEDPSYFINLKKTNPFMLEYLIYEYGISLRRGRTPSRNYSRFLSAPEPSPYYCGVTADKAVTEPVIPVKSAVLFLWTFLERLYILDESIKLGRASQTESNLNEQAPSSIFETILLIIIEAREQDDPIQIIKYLVKQILDNKEALDEAKLKVLEKLREYLPNLVIMSLMSLQKLILFKVLCQYFLLRKYPEKILQDPQYLQVREHLLRGSDLSIITILSFYEDTCRLIEAQIPIKGFMQNLKKGFMEPPNFSEDLLLEVPRFRDGGSRFDLGFDLELDDKLIDLIVFQCLDLLLSQFIISPGISFKALTELVQQFNDLSIAQTWAMELNCCFLNEFIDYVYYQLEAEAMFDQLKAKLRPELQKFIKGPNLKRWINKAQISKFLKFFLLRRKVRPIKKVLPKIIKQAVWDGFLLDDQLALNDILYLDLPLETLVKACEFVIAKDQTNLLQTIPIDRQIEAIRLSILEFNHRYGQIMNFLAEYIPELLKVMGEQYANIRTLDPSNRAQLEGFAYNLVLAHGSKKKQDQLLSSIPQDQLLRFIEKARADFQDLQEIRERQRQGSRTSSPIPVAPRVSSPIPVAPIASSHIPVAFSASNSVTDRNWYT